MGSVFVTRHAQERLREHHPYAGVRGALAMLSRSTEVSGGVVAGLLHRSIEATQDYYYLSEDYSGIFVLVWSREGAESEMTMITYIRLMPSQQAEARRLWGPSKNPVE